MENHHSLMLNLQEKHGVIFDLLKNKSFHYLDIPVHDNIGDLLIMQGTLRFFKRYGIQPKTISSLGTFDPAWIEPGDVIVFHGGGNFGDLYSNINDFREGMVERFARNMIIIMPQTIHFSSKEKEEKSALIFRKHANVHIFVRDKVTQAIAGKFSDNIYLVPDMAHQLYPMPYKKISAHGSLRIQRVDLEKRSTPPAMQGRVFEKVTDWFELVGAEKILISLVWRLEYRFKRYKWDRLAKAIGPMFWIPISHRFSRKAVHLFSQYETIVTDRLHGHILACLMSKPNIVIDNSYGKNSTYMNEWTIRSELVTLTKE
ncbi:MAG TPA: exopolysaccharide biosynthesis protein [Janthinobacterium sp.]|nr:exopolysaccharide biosynthesis protein [Janthinobacterium sp.]